MTTIRIDSPAGTEIQVAPCGSTSSQGDKPRQHTSAEFWTRYKAAMMKQMMNDFVPVPHYKGPRTVYAKNVERIPRHPGL